jgi:hypothetical protein
MSKATRYPEQHKLEQVKQLLISEAHVQQTVREFLELDGWRAIRTDPVSDRSRGKGFGEPGMPDYLFLRYETDPTSATIAMISPRARTFCLSRAAVLWIEFKRKSSKRVGVSEHWQPGRVAAHQLRWHEAERMRGALVLVVDDIDEFTKWYKASGLCRRIK